MQYILNEEEYAEFKKLDEFKQKATALRVARDEILKNAGIKCIHESKRSAYGYCDDCPCSRIAEGHDYDVWKLICGERPNYSK